MTTARSADRFWAKVDLSIHPRNWPHAVVTALKWDERCKLNTSKQPSGARKKRVISGLKRHVAAHPRDRQSADHLARLTG